MDVREGLENIVLVGVEVGKIVSSVEECGRREEGELGVSVEGG